MAVKRKIKYVENIEEKPIISNVEVNANETEIIVSVEATDNIGVTEYYYQIDESEEEVIKVLMTMTEAMNKKESIDEFLTSEIILEIDTTKQLSKIYRKSENNKILKKQSTIK